MKTVLYADVLFLINFGMDFISLRLTYLLFHGSTSTVRLFLSSLVGGLYGVVSVIIDLPWALSLAAGVFVSIIMILITFRKRPTARQTAKYSLIMWGTGALLGGTVSIVCSLGGGNSVELKTHSSPFFVIALAAAFCAGIVKAISSVSSVCSCRAEITDFGKTYELEMLVDSGNLVKEPISSCPVVFVSKRVFSEKDSPDVELLCKDVSNICHLSNSTKNRIRVVHIERPEGERLVASHFPERAVLYVGKKSKEVKCAVVIEDNEGYGNFDGVVPSSLLK